MAFCERPIFIVGTERSGSNLLRLVLNSHSRLFIPHPPHVMHLMKPLEGSYRDFGELVRDVVLLVHSHTFPWDIRLDPAKIESEARGRDLFAAYAAIHEAYRRKVGKSRWGCKSTFMINETEAILQAYPEAQFIHLVRDPRDVAVSARKSVFNHFHPWLVARLWAREQALALHLSEARAPAQVFRLHYEDLVDDPEPRVRELCGFLGESFEPDMLRFFESAEARRSASLCHDWRNTGQGFLSGNTRKFLRDLGVEDVALVEAAAEPQMRMLGYPILSDRGLRQRLLHPMPWTRLAYRVDDRIQKLRVEVASMRNDRNYPLRVRKWAVLLWLRLKAAMRRLSGR
jgi:hypothetical protein